MKILVTSNWISAVDLVFCPLSLLYGVWLVLSSKAVFGCCKTFSGKYIFSRNANFRKRKIFPCVLLHFKKFSEKYFLVFGVWKRRRKTQIRKHKPQPRKYIKSSTTTTPWSRSEIAIDGVIAISPSSRDRDRASDWSWSSDWSSRSRIGAGARDRAWIFSSLVRARAFSLSLIFRKCFEGKIEV